MLSKIFVAFSCLLAPLSALAQGRAGTGNPIVSIPVTFNSVFDDSNASTSNATCASDLERMNVMTFGGVQRWPFIGMFVIAL